MRRDKVLETASSLIVGERDKQHGDATQSFARIAAMWSLILNTDVEAHEVAACMCALKLSRLTTSHTNLDNWIDLAGYAALGAELATNKGESDADERR